MCVCLFLCVYTCVHVCTDMLTYVHDTAGVFCFTSYVPSLQLHLGDDEDRVLDDSLLDDEEDEDAESKSWKRQ